jgi:hypothetical protein
MRTRIIAVAFTALAALGVIGASAAAVSATAAGGPTPTYLLHG